MDSPEAAQRKEYILWVSRNGRGYTDEHTARWDGCTHVLCSTCGKPTPKHYLICDECRRIKRKAKYMAMPFREWDGKTLLCIHDTDTYFQDEDDIFMYCEENDIKSEDLDLVLCEPVMPHALDPHDFYSDDLAEDCDMPDEIINAFDLLNKTLATASPLSYREGKIRTTVHVDMTEG